MSEEAIKAPLLGKKRSKGKSIIGIDPLAWMNNADSHNEEFESSSSNDEITAEEVKDSQLVNEVLTEAGLVESDDAAEQAYENEEVNDMDMERADIGLNGKFKLDGPLTIADVGVLHEKFQASLDRDTEFEVDCSEVEGVDAAALQLLVACVNEIEKQDKKLVWKDISESMLSAVNLLGLQDKVKL